jgi:cytochrome c peroxidase
MLPQEPEPTTAVELGKKLFFDPILSSDTTIACASCHKPNFGFADTVAFSIGVKGRLGKRNAPSVTNMSERSYFFYDGRAATLQAQVKFPIEDHLEMNLPMKDAVKRIQGNATYIRLFKKIYKSVPNEKYIKEAIATFEKTLETSNTPFDRYVAGDSLAMSESAIRGRELFMSDKAKCFDCHFTPDFTGDEFRNIGIYDGKKYIDKGRYEMTKQVQDLGKFKVPSLRNVAATAPYMHNGMFATLKEVIEYYNNPRALIADPINMDSTLTKPLDLTIQEKVDLENFLIGLTDKRFTIRK